MNYFNVSRLTLPAFFVIIFATSSVSSVASDESLDAVISNHWDWVLEQYPEYRREYGDMSGNQSWTDLAPTCSSSETKTHKRLLRTYHESTQPH